MGHPRLNLPHARPLLARARPRAWKRLLLFLSSRNSPFLRRTRAHVYISISATGKSCVTHPRIHNISLSLSLSPLPRERYACLWLCGERGGGTRVANACPHVRPNMHRWVWILLLQLLLPENRMGFPSTQIGGEMDLYIRAEVVGWSVWDFCVRRRFLRMNLCAAIQFFASQGRYSFLGARCTLGIFRNCLNA